MRCNCENLKCPHGEKACRNEAGKKKVMYVGAVCDDCYKNMPPKYRLPEHRVPNGPHIRKISREYEVVVGNIGSVFAGSDPKKAVDVFKDYMKQSKEGYGRAAGEDVVLFEDGEIIVEYVGGSDPE